jgi:hypothetical protein
MKETETTQSEKVFLIETVLKAIPAQLTRSVDVDYRNPITGDRTTLCLYRASRNLRVGDVLSIDERVVGKP